MAWSRPWLLSAILLALSSSAQAQSTRTSAADLHPWVRMRIDPCIDASTDEVRRITAVELAAVLVDTTTAEQDVTQVTVGCSGGLVTLRVDDPITGKSIRRSVDLRDADSSARARLVALAVAELVYTSWSELALNPTPEVPASGSQASQRAVEAARRAVMRRLPRNLNPPQPLRLLGVTSRRAFFSQEGALWGGGLRLADDPFPWIGWSFDALVEHGVIRADVGTVSLDTFTIGGSILVHQQWSVLAMRAGLGIRGGVARMQGDPDRTSVAQGKSAAAPWGWPLGVFAFSVIPFRPLVLEVAAEAGYVVLPLGASSGPVREVTLDGGWWGLQFGMGMTL